MEKTVVENLGMQNGFERKRISLVNPPKQDVMGKANSYFTRDEKKIAKSEYKYTNR